MNLARLFALMILIGLPATLVAQEDTTSLETQKIAAERFLQVLINRPRPGTALDRVYGYHVQAETLDELIEDLTAAAKADGADAGSKLFLVGLLQLQQGRDAAAAESLTTAETLTTDAMTSFYLGRALLQVGNTAAAAAAFQRAIDRKPSRPEALSVYTELGRLYQRAQQLDKAIQVWDQLEQAFPGDARISERIARTLAEDDQPAEALKRYEKLVNDSQASGDAQNIHYVMEAAELKRKLGRQAEAITDLEVLLARLRPGSWLHGEARRRIETGLLTGGDFGALADYYAEQVQSRPDDLDATVRLGRALLQAGRLVEAESALTKATQQAPDNVEVRQVLIDILRAAGKPSELTKQFETLANLDDANPDYLVQWGNAILEDPALPIEKRRDKAADVWRRLLTAHPTDAVTTSQVATLLRRIERTDDSITLLRQAIELAPEQPQYREYLGEFLHQLGRHDEALATWQSLAAGDRRNAESLIRLAEVLYAFDEPVKSIAAFKEAANFDLTFAQRLRFASLLAKSEQYDDALRQLESVESIAETPEENEQILRQRIAVYSTAGQLEQRIATLQSTATNATDFRQLALMNDAAEKALPAIAAIEQALVLSPQDTGVLGIAGELYRKQSRFAESIEIFSKLSAIDSRFRTSYQQLIAEMQMQLGKIDDALATVNEIIAASPGNPAPYQMYAEFCFQAGRDDVGLESLRRATRIAPRDNEVRNALAAALAQRFRTEEALELYWQSFLAGDDMDAKSNAVRVLAPLYERQAGLKQLTSRLEQYGRDKSDMRLATMLIAEANEVTGDLGSARETLQPLLITNPRDAELLARMVRISLAIGDKEIALEHQQQLVNLADTPDNRQRLLMLMIDTDKTTEIAVEQLRSGIDTTAMVAMIDRALQAGNYSLAVKLCEGALQLHSDLWEVKTRLAYGLLCAQQDDYFSAAAAAARDVLSLEIPDDTSPTSKPAPATSKGNVANTQPVVPSPGGKSTQPSRLTGKAHSNYPNNFAVQFKLGSAQFANVNQLNNRIDIDQYYQARDVAIGVLMVIAAKRSKLVEQFEEFASLTREANSPNERRLWDTYFADNYRIWFAGLQNSYDSTTEMIKLHLALYGGADGRQVLMHQLELRFRFRNRVMSTRLSMTSQQSQPVNMTLPPLSQESLEVLKSISQEMLTRTDDMGNVSSLATIYDEFSSSGQAEFAKQISTTFDTANDPKSLLPAVGFFIRSKQYTQATAKLLTAREVWKSQPLTARPSGIDAVIRDYLVQLASVIDDPSQWRELIRIAMQIEIDSRSSIPQYSPVTTQPTTISRRVISIKGVLELAEIQRPMFQTIFDASAATSLYSSVVGLKNDEVRRIAMLASLSVLRDQAKSEDKRELQIYAGTAYAFAQWWAGDFSSADLSMQSLAESFPDRHDLQIEAARFAIQGMRPAEALALLEKIEPLDQAMQQTREWMVMNLAIQLQRGERAKEAANRLCYMKLDTQTQIAMISKLNLLNMTDLSHTMLNRLKLHGSSSPKELNEIAHMLSANGETEAAIQAATQVIKQIATNRTPESESYHMDALAMLSQLGVLEKLIAQAERRVKAAPKSASLKRDLAALQDRSTVPNGLTAAQVRERALLGTATTSRSGSVTSQIGRLSSLNDPRVIIQAAARLAREQKPDEALEMYLLAFKADPGLLDRYSFHFLQLATDATQIDKTYQAMLTFDLNQIQTKRLHTFLETLKQRCQPSTSFFDLMTKLLQSGPIESIPNWLRLIGDSENKEIKPVMTAGVRRMFEDRAAFQLDGVFVSAISNSTDANVTGALAPCLQLMKHDAELTAFVSKAVNDQITVPDHQVIASMIQIALNADSATPESLAERIDRLVSGHSKQLPVGLLRELSQILDQRPEAVTLSAKLLEAADTVGNPLDLMEQFQSSVAAQLADAYWKAGRRDACIERLMDAFTLHLEDNSTSPKDISNPGLREYQLLRSLEAIGSKLAECNAPYETTMVLQFALRKNERFVIASRLGSEKLRLSMQEKLALSVSQITSESALDFVDRQTHRMMANFADKSKDAGTNTPEVPANFRFGSLLGAEGESITAMESVCDLLKTDEAGRLALNRLDEALTTVTERVSETDKLRLAASRAKIAMAINPNAAPERITALHALLPTEQQWADGTASIKAIDALELVSVAIAGLDSDHIPTMTAADQLAAALSNIAAREVDGKAFSALTKARHRVSKQPSPP